MQIIATGGKCLKRTNLVLFLSKHVLMIAHTPGTGGAPDQTAQKKGKQEGVQRERVFRGEGARLECNHTKQLYKKNRCDKIDLSHRWQTI